MCGIVGAVAERNVVPILMEGLRRLEYRGYDSAGIAILNGDSITRVRRVGKVQELQNALDENPLRGNSGISHTRWATHGAPNEANAHPHMSEDDIAIVHNGIIENYEELRDDLQKHGFEFESQTDTEVVAHRIKHHLKKSGELTAAVRATVAELEGAYALVVISASDPNKLVLARAGCPVVIGLGIGENFVASDVAALLPVTRKFMFLDEGDIAVVQKENVTVFDANGEEVTLATNGPLRIFIRCAVNDGGEDRITLFVTSSLAPWYQSNSKERFAGEVLDVSEIFIPTNTPELVDFFPGSALAPNGSAFTTVASISLGLNLFGHRCVALGDVTAIKGNL